MNDALQDIGNRLVEAHNLIQKGDYGTAKAAIRQSITRLEVFLSTTQASARAVAEKVDACGNVYYRIERDPREHVLALRALIAKLPITHCNSHPELQAWWDEMKVVMSNTEPASLQSETRSARALLRKVLSVGLDDSGTVAQAQKAADLFDEINAYLASLQSETPAIPQEAIYRRGFMEAEALYFDALVKAGIVQPEMRGLARKAMRAMLAAAPDKEEKDA